MNRKMLKSHKTTTLCYYERTYTKICHSELKVLTILLLTVILSYFIIVTCEFLLCTHACMANINCFQQIAT